MHLRFLFRFYVLCNLWRFETSIKIKFSNFIILEFQVRVLLIFIHASEHRTPTQSTKQPFEQGSF